MRDRKVVTLRAHFDGEQIRLDEPFELNPGTKLIVTILPKQAWDDHQAWLDRSRTHLNDAYGEDEPDYALERIQERNPDYEGS